MKKSILFDIHPMYSMEILKENTSYKEVDEIIEHLKERISENPEGGFITVFDHYQHTREIDGKILDSIVAVKNLLFCFGHSIGSIEIVAFRPKSIAIVETKDSFILEFLETPRPEVNAWVQSWIKEIENNVS